jgi:hypothetical protein
MQFNGGGRRSAVVLLWYTLTSGLSATVCATAEEPAVSNSAERYGIDPVRLGAMPAESRALFKEVLGRLDIMRGEMAGLRADTTGRCFCWASRTSRTWCIRISRSTSMLRSELP